jgi:hypothetical protein
MSDTLKEETVGLEEIKAMLDGTRNQQLRARIEFAKRLKSLGFYSGHEYEFPHPYEEGKIVKIHYSSDYDLSYEEMIKNGCRGWFEVNVEWQTSHGCDDDCGRDCDGYDKHSYPATAEEIVAVLRTKLLSNLENEKEELQRDWELAKAIPTAEEIASLRRKIEDYLRKSPRDIVAVAKLLKFVE